jgi:hypothetical protein
VGVVHQADVSTRTVGFFKETTAKKTVEDDPRQRVELREIWLWSMARKPALDNAPESA